jgi:hypothetical protein
MIDATMKFRWFYLYYRLQIAYSICGSSEFRSEKDQKLIGKSPRQLLQGASKFALVPIL